MPPLELVAPETIAWVAVAALAGGFVRGFSGFGGPAVMILALVPFFAPVSVLSKVLVIDFMANIKLLPSAVRNLDRTTAVPVISGTLVGAAIGFYFLNSLDGDLMKRVIGAIAGTLTLLMLVGLKLKQTPPLWGHLGLGVFAGLILGSTNIAFAAAIYFFALPIAASQGRANLIVWGFVTSIGLICAHLALGNLNLESTGRAALVGVAYLAGASVGARVYQRVSERDFRRLILCLLLVLSLVSLLY